MGRVKHQQELSVLLDEIHSCRLCPQVFPNLVARSVFANWSADLVLMAQAPSEHGVRVSGIHWVDSNGNLRPPGGTYLESFLRRIGFSIDPLERHLPRPYTTNVLHCWPGSGGKRDRPPSPNELRNCSKSWKAELRLLTPKAILLLGKPAADAFARACGLSEDFDFMLESQGHCAVFDGVNAPFFTVPHPTAPYRGARGSRSAYYELAFNSISAHLSNAS